MKAFPEVISKLELPVTPARYAFPEASTAILPLLPFVYAPRAADES